MLNTSKIRNLAVVFLVRDLSRTLAFYAETLGLTFEQADLSEGYLMASLPGDASLVFFEGEAAVGATPQVVFGLDRGGIESIAEALAARGVELITPVSEAPGGFSVDFKDPDGHLLSLYQDEGLPMRE